MDGSSSVPCNKVARHFVASSFSCKKPLSKVREVHSANEGRKICICIHGTAYTCACTYVYIAYEPVSTFLVELRTGHL